MVPKESATFEGYASFSIHANYSDIVKFASVEENGLKRLLRDVGRIRKWKDSKREIGSVVEGYEIGWDSETN